jgi:autotransporter-associated beta strand protein
MRGRRRVPIPSAIRSYWALSIALLAAGATAADAQNATWVGGNAGDANEWVEPNNWGPTTVPSGIAIFANTGVTTVANDAGIVVIGAINFALTAQAYTINIDNPFIVNGAGVTNNSTNTQTFNVTGGNTLVFQNGSTANNGTGPVSYSNSSFITFENSSNAGNANTTITNNDILQFNDSSSAGSAHITNNVETDFFSTSTAGSANITNASTGTITFNNNATAGTATIGNAGLIDFNNSSNAGTTANITNSGLHATITFNDSSSAGSATITNAAGTTTFSAMSTAGSATITTLSGGSVNFTGNSTGGNAQFITNGTGFVDFSATSGPTGNHQISAGSIAGSGNYFLGANALTVGGNNQSPAVSGVISDCGTGGTQCAVSGATGGSLIKVGTGTLTLSGVNTYTGPTGVTAGTLEVDGSIATSSLTTVSGTGTLTGTGTVGNTALNAGTFAPGNGTAGSHQTVQGNLTVSNGTYQVYLNPTTSSYATVTGNTNLTGGGVNATFASGSYVAHDYEILAGTHAGTFANGLTTSNAPSGFAETLDYSNPAGVFLDLTATLGTLGTSNLNQNQQNVANGLNNFFNNGGTLPPNFLTLFGLSGSALANTLTQLDGEDATDAQKGAFQLMSDFLNLMLDPSSGGGTGGGGGGTGGGALGFAPAQDTMLPPEIALAYSALLTKALPKPQSFDQRWTAWGSAFGGTSHTNGDPVVGSNNVDASDYGFAGGADYRVSPDTVLGFALAGGGTDWNLAQGLGNGRSDAFQAGVYAKTHAGPAYLSAALAFANNWFTTDRTSALGDQLQAKFQGQSYGGRIEAGYRYGLPSANGLAGVTPYAAMQAQSFHTPSYTETDLTGGGFGLAFNAMTATDTRSELGARFDDLAMLGATPLILRARLAGRTTGSATRRSAPRSRRCPAPTSS